MSESTQIFLVGVGAAYASLVRLLGDNGTSFDYSSVIQRTFLTTLAESCTAADAEQKIHLIAFVADNSLKAISRMTGEDVGKWYYEVSKLNRPTERGADDLRTRRSTLPKTTPPGKLSNGKLRNGNMVTYTNLRPPIST